MVGLLRAVARESRNNWPRSRLDTSELVPIQMCRSKPLALESFGHGQEQERQRFVRQVQEGRKAWPPFHNLPQGEWTWIREKKIPVPRPCQPALGLLPVPKESWPGQFARMYQSFIPEG